MFQMIKNACRSANPRQIMARGQLSLKATLLFCGVHLGWAWVICWQELSPFIRLGRFVQFVALHRTALNRDGTGPSSKIIGVWCFFKQVYWFLVDFVISEEILEGTARQTECLDWSIFQELCWGVNSSNIQDCTSLGPTTQSKFRGHVRFSGLTAERFKSAHFQDVTKLVD